MEPIALSAPIALFVYNRPDLTAKVFAQIRKVRPRRLLVIADGPKSTGAPDKLACEETRRAVSQVDWPCDVSTNFAESNLGCRARVSSGIDWVFQQVDSAIILEDDCYPDLTFFRYCQELLEYYEKDTRIMMISGHINQLRGSRFQASYYYSKMPHIWGWATWRRAWKHYDVDMKAWPSIEKGGWLQDIFGRDELVRHWNALLTRTYQRQIDTWDFQWMFACWINGGLCVNPTRNLVTNIGCGEGATNTTAFTRFANLPTVPMDFPLKHPPFMISDNRANIAVLSQFYERQNLFIRLRTKIRYLSLKLRKTGDD